VNHVASFLYKYNEPYGSADYKMSNHLLPAKTKVKEKVELFIFMVPCIITLY